jgi:hypothetical protein
LLKARSPGSLGLTLINCSLQALRPTQKANNATARMQIEMVLMISNPVRVER